MLKGYPRPNYAAYDTKMGVPDYYKPYMERLEKDTAQERAASQEQLNRLKAYATGEKSMARETAGKMDVAQRLGQRSLSSSAQRGGRSGAAQRGATYGADTASRDIAGKRRVAAQLERQSAAQQFAKQSSAALKERLSQERMKRAYGQMGLTDKDRRARFMGKMSANDATRAYRELQKAKRSAAWDDRVEEAWWNLANLPGMVFGGMDLL